MSPASLCDRYRPATLGDMAGNERARTILRAFLSAPRPSAWLLEGPSGVGKTTAALAIARALAGDLDILHAVGADVGAEWVRETWATLRLAPWKAGGWRVVIVDEADTMSRHAQTLLLHGLEALPARSIVLFTSNEAPDAWESRFLSRVKHVHFTAQGMAEAGAARLLQVAEAEGFPLAKPAAVAMMRAAGNNLRGALQALELDMLAATVTEAA